MAFNLKNESLAEGVRKAHFCSFFFVLLLFEGCQFGYFVVNFFILKMSLNFYKRTYTIYKQKSKRYSIQKIPGLNAITRELILLKYPRRFASARSCACYKNSYSKRTEAAKNQSVVRCELGSFIMRRSSVTHI